jgi:hypothetical protein
MTDGEDTNVLNHGSSAQIFSDINIATHFAKCWLAAAVKILYSYDVPVDGDWFEIFAQRWPLPRDF